MGARNEARDAAFEKVTGPWIAIPTPFTAESTLDEKTDGLISALCLAEDLT